jgi:uncharacterized protein YecT (DUF1311 family)
MDLDRPNTPVDTKQITNRGLLLVLPKTPNPVKIIAATLLLFVAGAHACQRNEHGVFEELRCASEAHAAADRELNRQYQALIASLDGEQRQLLVRSQRTWLASIKQDIEFIYALQGDGAEGRLVVVNFNETQTRMRSKALGAWKRR